MLKYFAQTAEEGNITRAAQKLHVTQPTMSKQLKDLETELGVKLFTRSNYSIKLTQAGELLKKRAEDILSLAAKTKDEFKTMDDGFTGNIYVGCPESQSIRYFAKAFNTLRVKYPKICCHIYSGNRREVTEKLDKGILDFALLSAGENSGKYTSIELPFKDSWGLVMPRTSPLAKKKYILTEELQNIPLICSRQWIEQDMHKWFGKNADKLNIAGTYNLAYNAAILAKEGLGYVLTYDELVNTSKGSKLCFRPVKNVPEAKMYIIWKKDQKFSHAAGLMLAELKKRFR